MYLFLLFALPLGFWLLCLLLYPREERADTKKALLRGLIASIPTWILARLFDLVMPEFWGSFLSILAEWFNRFLPYALMPALGYSVFYRLDERLPLGYARRRLTAFYAGALAPMGLFETIMLWGKPSAYANLFLPFLVAALVLCMPPLVLNFKREYGKGKLKPALMACALTLAASAVRPLFLAQLWPLAVILVAAIAAYAWFKAEPELASH
jgi:hypothetical protein